MPHFVTRQIFTGAGKVGIEASGVAIEDVPFQLTQRADFFEEEVGLETTLKRPIVNTRDEPHADAQKYRRLHVIVGDANLAEVATFLKVGTTALVLSMIEDDFLPRDLALARRCRRCAGCPTTSTLRRAARAGRRRHDDRARDPVGAASTGPASTPRSTASSASAARRSATRCCAGGRRCSPASRPTRSSLGRPARLGGQVPADRRLPRAPRPRLGRRPPGGDGPPVPRPAAGEVAVRAGWASSGSPTDDEVERGRSPSRPRDTRAYFRGKCLQRWADDIVAANWDSLVFDVGGDPLRRVPMMEPLRGTAAHVGSLVGRVRDRRRAARASWGIGEGADHGRTRAEEEAGARRSRKRSSRRPRRSPSRARRSRPSSTISSTKSTRCSRRTQRTS